MNPRLRLLLVCCWIAVTGGFQRAHAQWLTQSVVLRPGWTAIHLHVNATNDTLDNLVGVDSPITEIWMWQPNLSEGRILTGPVALSGTDWAQWTRATGPANAFPLRANSTYLVRISGASDYVWNLKGVPVPPSVRWTASGLNFIGFSTRPDNPPKIANFLAPTKAAIEFGLFHYPGGEAPVAPPNAVSLDNWVSRSFVRGEAYWVRRDGVGSPYFGPFETALQDYRGIAFSDVRATYSFRLRNQLDVTNTVVATLLPSESSPSGESLPVPPLLLRTARDMTTLRYGFMPVGAGTGTNFVLAPKGNPGSEVEVVLGLDRSNMAGTNGAPFAAILRLQDATLGQLQVDLPVSATKDSSDGLWVGEASINQVGNYLKTYARATNAVDFTNQLAQLNLLNEGLKTVSFPGEPWTPHSLAIADRSPIAASNQWVAVASSADGSRLVAAITNGPLYVSADFGATWSVRESVRAWVAVASSADGSRLVAGVAGGQLYTSADAGGTWIARDGARAWSAVASSADGGRLLAAESGGTLYVSSDFGATWSPQETARAWSAVASSADGTNLVAAASGDQIFTSADGGSTWIARETARAWVSVATSSNGLSLVAAVSGGRLFTSVDAGENWTARDSDRNWTSVSTSGSGSVQLAAVSGGQIYASADAGVTWVARAGARDWRSVAMSVDGTRGIGAAFDGQLFLSGDTGVTWETVAPYVSSVASSADGQTLVAAVRGSRLYTSTDGGTNWSVQLSSPVSNWTSVAASASGATMVAAVEGGGVHVSTDSGATWSQSSAPNGYWQGVALSADGTEVVAVGDGINVHTSANGGQTWVQRIPLAGQAWQAVASSSDGQRLLAAVRGGQLFASTNAGAAWAPLHGAPSAQWKSVASSADGKVLFAAESPGGIYASADGGTTWDLKAGAPLAARWRSVVCSTNGSAVAAVMAGGKAYTSTDGGRSWTPRDGDRAWTAIASSENGTRLLAAEAGAGGTLLSVAGTLVTPELTFDPNSGLILSGGGKYLEASFDTELGDVPAPFPLRLIVHQGSDGTTRLLQRVYVGPGLLGTNTILTLQESKLDPANLSRARRLSAVHLPLAGAPWIMEGTFGGVGILNVVLTEGFANSASNPFLHAYHPDHDNLDALYQPITKPGVESYDIRRQITLSFTPPGDDFASRTAGSSRLQGTYLENIVLKGGNNQTRTVVTKGAFVINRVSSIATIQ